MIGYLVKKGCFKKISTHLLILLTILFISGGIGIQLFFGYKGQAYWIWYNSIFILVASTCLFEWFSRIKFETKRKGIEKISEYSFSIYLIHNMVRKTIFGYIAQMSTHHFLQNGFLWILCILLSLIVAMAIDKIPKVGKFILFK